MSDMINRNDALEIIQSMYPGIPRVPWLRKDWQERYEPYIRAEKAIRGLPSAQPDCIECLRKIDDYGEEHYVGDNDKMFWDIRSILENPKHSEANHYGESTEIVRCKDCKHRDPEDEKCDS